MPPCGGCRQKLLEFLTDLLSEELENFELNTERQKHDLNLLIRDLEDFSEGKRLEVLLVLLSIVGLYHDRLLLAFNRLRSRLRT